MDKELSVIDGILLNLAGILRFYEFERTQHHTLLRLLKQFQKETCQEKELESSNEIFTKESNKEIQLLEEKIKSIDKKIEQIRTDISKRNDSREKLVSLFNSLKSIDSLDCLSAPEATQPQENFQGMNNSQAQSLPIMEIREELNEDGEVISSEIKPYQSPEEQLKSLFNKKQKGLSQEEKKEYTDSHSLSSKMSQRKSINSDEADSRTKKEKLLLDEKNDPNSENFLPFVIREEIDEDGNIIKSSMSRIPQMKPDNTEEANASDTHKESATCDESKEIDDDQLAELFEDMGFSIPKISEIQPHEEITGFSKAGNKNGHGKDEENSISKAPLKDEHSSDAASGASSSFPISRGDLYTLELITDELNREEENDEGYEDESPAAEEEFEEDNGSDEEFDDYDIQKRVLSNMFGSKGQNLFAQQLMKLRGQQKNTNSSVAEEVRDVFESPKISEITPEVEEVKTELCEQKNLKKVNKSVSFNSVVDIKQVDDIWDDIRRSNAEAELKERRNEAPTSFFKRSRGTIEECERDEITSNSPQSEAIISDVIERQVVECASNPIQQTGVFKAFEAAPTDKNITNIDEKEKLVKLSGKKGISKFKLARVAEIGRKFQETHIPAETREQLQQAASLLIGDQNTVNKKVLKKNLKSLTPKISIKNAEHSKKIEAPKDINPLPVNPQSLADEDYEIVRHEANDCLFDDDEDMPEDEFVVPEYMELKPQTLANAEKTQSNLALQNDSKEKDYFPDYLGDQKEPETNVIGTTLDYKSLSENMDTMAKAYVLGLYDDDIHTTGEVIEKLEDFKKHNQIVEDKNSSRLHERVDEINNQGKPTIVEKEDKPVLVSDIVENDLDEIMEANSIPDDQLDIELNDETLTTEVALDYAKIRSNMIHKYKGGFRETEKEKEFVRPEGSEKVSRFKMARLGI